MSSKESKSSLRVFEAFFGYMSQSMALKKYSIDYTTVGGSEIDEWAIIASSAVHGEDKDISYPTIEDMLEELLSKNIALDFKTGKTPWEKLLTKNKLSTKEEARIKRIYKACLLTKNFGDISNIDPVELPDMDLFTYSFPCQDISMAGKQRGLSEGSETRSSLLWECEKIIKSKKPKYLMMENVKNLVGKKHKPDFDRWLEILEGLGYQNHWKVINAKHCGVPQNRERVFCVSILGGGNFSFYDDFDGGVRLKDILENEVDEKYYLSDEMTKGFVETFKNQGYINQNTQASKVHNPNKEFQTLCAGTHGYANGYVKEVEACAIRGRSPNDPKSRVSGLPTVQMLEVKEDSHISNCLTTVQKDSLILESNKLDMVGMLDIKGNESIRRVYDPKGLSPALTTMQGGNRQPKIIEPFRIRKLTPRECFRLMGVSDSDIDKIQATGISNSQQYKMAGNSIVVDCMEFLTNLPNIGFLEGTTYSKPTKKESILDFI